MSISRLNCVVTGKEWEGDAAVHLMSMFKFPKYLKEQGAKDITDRFLVHIPKYRLEVADMFGWLNELEPEELVDDDRYDVKDIFASMCMSWRYLSLNFGATSKEDAHRKAVDDLIGWAFHTRPNMDQFFRIQAPVYVHPERFVADGIITKDLPIMWAIYIGQLKSNYVFSWSWVKSTMKLPANVITFAFEANKYDREEALRQLTLDLYCAQKHRRALCMTDGPVFGAILDDGVVEIFVSNWMGQQLVVNTIFPTCNLKYFSQFVLCYFAFATIAEYQERWLSNEFDRWDNDEESQRQKMDDSTKEPWRNAPEDEPDAGRTGTKRAFEDDELRRNAKRRATKLDWNMRNLPLSSLYIYGPTEVNMVAFGNYARTESNSDSCDTEDNTAVWVEDTHRFHGKFEEPNGIYPDFDSASRHSDLGTADTNSE